jgi:hypothetical protein
MRRANDSRLFDTQENIVRQAITELTAVVRMLTVAGISAIVVCGPIYIVGHYLIKYW